MKNIQEQTMKIDNRKHLLVALYSKVLQNKDPRLIKKLNSLPFYEGEFSNVIPVNTKKLPT